MLQMLFSGSTESATSTVYTQQGDVDISTVAVALGAPKSLLMSAAQSLQTEYSHT